MVDWHARGYARIILVVQKDVRNAAAVRVIIGQFIGWILGTADTAHEQLTISRHYCLIAILQVRLLAQNIVDV